MRGYPYRCSHLVALRAKDHREAIRRRRGGRGMPVSANEHKQDFFVYQFAVDGYPFYVGLGRDQRCNTDTGTEMTLMRWGMPPPPGTTGFPRSNCTGRCCRRSNMPSSRLGVLAGMRSG